MCLDTVIFATEKRQTCDTMKTKMRHTSIHFYCRKTRANKEGLATIEMFVKIGDKRKSIPLEMQYRCENFNKDKDSKKPNTLQDFLNATRERAMIIMTDMRRKGIPITMDNFYQYWVEGGVDKVYTLDELFAEYLKLKQDDFEAGKITKPTMKRYKDTKDIFYRLCGLKGTESVHSITIQQWKMFESGLLKEQKPSYACGWLKKVKSIFNYAWQTGKISANPFYGTKIDRGEIEITYLTDEELDIIRNKQFVKEKYNRVRDVFLFQCATALSYGDMVELKKEDIKEQDKQYYLMGYRKKTGSKYVVPLTEEALSLLKKYDYQLPFISPQQYNKHLKTIGEICEIDKPFSSHLARRTGACYMVNHGVKDEIVAKVLGDSVEMVRKHYAVLFDNTVLKEVGDMQKRELEKTIMKILNS